MGDLLIRNIDDNLKRMLSDQARKHGRSLSEEALLQIRKSLAQRQEHPLKPGDWLAAMITGARFEEDELAEIERSRREPDRDPPAFD